MSFYLGYNYEGRPLLHLTSGQRTVPELKGSPLSDSIFHSDMEVIKYDRYNNIPVRVPTSSAINWPFWVSASTVLPNHSPRILDMPDEAYQAALNGKGIMFIVNLVDGSSYILRPTIRYIDPYTSRITLINAYYSYRLLEGSFVWVNETTPIDSLLGIPHIAPQPEPLTTGVRTDKVILLLPDTGVQSVDVLVLEWGSTFIFTPKNATEITVKNADIMLGTDTSSSLSSIKFIRTGPEQVDYENSCLPVKTSNSGSTLKYLELMNDPPPTGTSLFIRPDTLVVKGRTIADSSRSSKLPKYKLSDVVTVPSLTTNSTTLVKQSTVIVASGTFKPTDTIMLYLGIPRFVDRSIAQIGCYGPFTMSEMVYLDTHRSYTPNALWTQYNILMTTDASGNFVLTVEAGVEHSSATIVVNPFLVSYLVFPEG